MFLSGSMVALVTPMKEDGSIDERSLHELVEWHIQSKTNAIIVAGTTGESATLDPEEQLALVKLVTKQVANRIPVIAGAGTNSTKTTMQLADNAKRAGADGCLIVTPYYNKPTQNGLYQHYKYIAEHVSIPMIMYNVPMRTACDMLPETIEKLAKIKNIIGIKEATGKIDRTQEIIERCGKNFEIYSGDDLSALDLMLHGAVGVISVTANIVPQKMYEMCTAVFEKNKEKAEKINQEMILLHKRLFIESNPIPTKWALHTMGKIEAGIRMPLLPLDTKYHLEVKEAMQKAGVIII